MCDDFSFPKSNEMHQIFVFFNEISGFKPFCVILQIADAKWSVPSWTLKEEFLLQGIGTLLLQWYQTAET